MEFIIKIILSSYRFKKYGPKKKRKHNRES